ncbi:MAG: zinc ribbon domain-containing protein [Lachnospiraceae bacterium]|jgi:hypothetical protein|nr:zinc ribbon domain-containing protein [Lachnospiraceae bacterium]
MFFIFGINSGRKEIEYVKTILCKRCSTYGRYELFMTYMYFSLFFIPIFKWKKQYYVRTTCCGTMYELDPVIGKRIQKGENISISDENLTLVQSGFQNGWSYTNTSPKKTCSHCGYETSEEFNYCPKCGEKLDD